jgi:hypothetical protein
MKPVTRADAERMTWQALQNIQLTITETREQKPQVDIFSSIQTIRETQQKRAEAK